MRYWPVSSLTTERVRSIRTGLAASTVTPGRTAPEVSRTTPVIAACANAAAGRSKTTNRAPTDRRAKIHIVFLLFFSREDRVCASDECGYARGTAYTTTV